MILHTTTRSYEEIFSENPENDLWRELLQFTYEANIKRYFEEHNIGFSSDVIDCIIGSFLQAYEYYKASKTANLQIEPLLLYYGTTNLLYGMSALLSGSISNIKNHGMKIDVPTEMQFIADTSLRFMSPNDGGIHIFARALNFTENLTDFGDWTLSEFLDSIAEINNDYQRCYNKSVGKIVMLDVFNTPDGKVEKVYYTSSTENKIRQTICDVDGFRNSYLPLSKASSYQDNTTYFILLHKLNGQRIDEISYSGQPYLRAHHQKNGKWITIPTVLNMYISLFVLATLCRYYPQKWSPFVLKDTSGERLLIEKLLHYSKRMIPNFILNHILGKNIQYISAKYSPVDTIKHIGEHEVQELVKREIRLYEAGKYELSK